MHHESGIPDYINLLVGRGFSVTGTSPTFADALAALENVGDLRFALGARWEYSNSNYFLLGQIVLAVTSADLGTFLTAEVFDPLGLEMVMDPLGAIDNKAVSYKDADGKWEFADSRWEPAIGAGSIQPPRASWWRGRRSTGSPPSVPRTIDAERFEGAADAGQGLRYGAGIYEVDVGGDLGRMLGHDGLWGGFVTVFSVAPVHRVAVAVTCTSESVMRRLGRALDVDLLTAWIGSNLSRRRLDCRIASLNVQQPAVHVNNRGDVHMTMRIDPTNDALNLR